MDRSGGRWLLDDHRIFGWVDYEGSGYLEEIGIVGETRDCG